MPFSEKQATRMTELKSFSFLKNISIFWRSSKFVEKQVTSFIKKEKTLEK